VLPYFFLHKNGQKILDFYLVGLADENVYPLENEITVHETLTLSSSFNAMAIFHFR